MKKYLYIIPAMTVPFIASIFYFVIFDGEKTAQIIYLLAKIFIFIFPVFFIKNLVPFKKAFKFDLGELLFGAIIGVAIFISGYVIIKFPIVMNEIKMAKPFVEAKINNFGVANHYILMAVVISFAHSMLEEYYWRWFVYGASKRNVLSAISFSLHHFIVLNYYFIWSTAFILTFIVALGGVLFNLLYKQKESIWAPWGAHVGADLFIFYVGFLLLN